MIALFSACMDRTEMVSGKYPSSEYVTVNASLMGTNNAHGVRQVPAFEACASAPGGFEWIITVEVGDGASRSRLGMFEVIAEQPASARLHAAAAINAIDRGPAFRILQFATGLAMNPTFEVIAMGKKIAAAPRRLVGGTLTRRNAMTKPLQERYCFRLKRVAL
jgi:hypothetical protein